MCFKFLRNYGIIDYVKSLGNEGELDLEYNRELTNNFNNINNGNEGLILNKDTISKLNNTLADSHDYYNYLQMKEQNKKL